MTGWLVVWHHRDMMLRGLLATFEISAVASICAAILALPLFALGLRSRFVALSVTWLIDLMRVTPFLLFLYLVYYALPAWHIMLGPVTAGVVALALYNAAYFTELLRAAWLQIPHEEIEAGLAFGHHGFGLLRRVIIERLLLIALPTLGNQTIQIVKDSAFLVIITVEELTYTANELQATYYIPFAGYVTAALLYWALCLLIEASMRALLGRAVWLH